MSKEIELKAHIDDLNKTLSIIRNTRGVSHECFQEKKDIYFSNNIEQPSCRVRLERKGQDKNHLIDTVLITVKEKKSNDGIEVNEEIEFDSKGSNFDLAVRMFNTLGYKQVLLKEKVGYSFVLDKFNYPLHIEVLEIAPLGWFLEIEFTPEQELSEIEIDNLKSNLLTALKMFNLSENNIEQRYYRDMLNDVRGVNYGI